MSSGKGFVDMLKRVHYPNAERLNGTSFDWMFEDKDLAPFLECICYSIGEENVLTSEELAQYEALQADKSFDSTLFERTLDSTEAKTSEEDLLEEISDFENNIFETEKNIKILEMQRNQVSMQEMELNKKSEDLVELNKHLQKEVRLLKEEVVPEAIAKYIAEMDAVVGHVKELDNVLNEVPESCIGATIKTFFQLDIQPYLEIEEIIMNRIKTYLNDNFKKLVTQRDKISDDLSGLLDPKFAYEVKNEHEAEALRLKTVRQITEEDYVEACIEKAKLESSLKYCNDLLEKGAVNYNLTHSQLRVKLEKAKKEEEENKQEMKKMLAEYKKLNSNFLQVQYDRVAILSSREKLERYETYLAKLKLPLDLLYAQRARLEFLLMTLTIEENGLQDTKNRVQSIIEDLQKDIAEYENQKFQYAEKMKEAVQENDEHIPEDSVLFSINKVLGNDADKQLLYLTGQDILEKVKKLRQTESELQEKSRVLLKEQYQWMHTVESSAAVLEDFVHEKKWSGAQHPLTLQHELNVSLNKLGIRLQDIEEKILQEMKNYQEKKKVIEQNSNLSKARKLFIHALTDREKFLKCIEDIKIQVENCGELLNKH